MKLKHTKNTIIILICLLILVCGYALFKSRVFIELKLKGGTDVFYGTYHGDVITNTTQESSNNLFNITVVNNPQRVNQIGNAMGTVVVNDPTDMYKSVTHSSNQGAIFYTKYDAVNNWYTVIEVKQAPYIPMGQIPINGFQ